ncbi:MAG: hypothetical protein LBN18_08925 [Dysgonamonadaceae bacterium]|jgi:single-stranded DNA-specific DHH superfamily exonuclease|nr:hypothetical protein [Dysgonamonadaceae bacterium]
MSKSKRKPIIKDNPSRKELFRRRIRRRQNQETSIAKYLEDTEEFQLTDDKSIVNDYDYCDYKIDWYHGISGFFKRLLSKYTKEELMDDIKKYSRK